MTRDDPTDRPGTDGGTAPEPPRDDHSAHAALLRNRLRRRVLRLLLDDGPIEVGSLAVALADGPSAGRSDESVRRTRVSLCHVHLPALADHGYLEYDRAEGVVRRAERLSRLEAQFGGDEEAPPAVAAWARAIR